jgi:glutathione S-transferase
MADEIIFHHYWTSPFSEKVRLAFGLKGLAWRSVEQPTIMPKPHLIPLTGGYRKIPVMQIGADIYCDSQLILAELERRFPEVPLMPNGGLSHAVGFWADRVVFQAAVAVIFGSLGDKVDPAFVKDREALSGRPFDPAQMAAAVPLMREQFRAHTSFLEAQLKARGLYLSGAHATVSDIHAHMNVWFLSSFTPAEAEKLLAEFPLVRAWYAVMNTAGHGTHTKMTPDEALAVAKAATSIAEEHADPHEPNGLKPGMAVTVMADDYGRDPIKGTLVASSAQRIAIRRSDPAVGDVVVHFPRAGFWVLPG